MCMLQLRLQVLLDEDRHERIAREATRRGVSVGRVVREAIDRSYPPTSVTKREALTDILAATPMDLPEPDALRRELDAAHDRWR